MRRKIKGRRTIIQSHMTLAMRIRAMLSRLWHDKMSDEEKRRYYDLEEQAMAHERKAALFGDAFTMIL